MHSRNTVQVQCRRIASALLPAAELLLRGAMDVRLKHWQDALSGHSAHSAVEEACCTAFPDVM